MLPNNPDWSDSSRFVAMILKGSPMFYVAFNMFHYPVSITLPKDHSWREIVRTDKDWDMHYLRDLRSAPILSSQIELPPHSSLLAGSVT